jgi:asparagine synthetase B (glutamine-hydrolysing)
MNRISGEWDWQHPTQFRYHDSHTSVQGRKEIGPNLSVDAGAVSMEIFGGVRRLYMHISPPGWHSMYYVIKDSIIHFDESGWALRRKLSRCTPVHVLDGIVYVFTNKGLARYRGDAIQLPEITNHTVDEFWKLFLDCTAEIYKGIGSPLVLTTISGGTDGIMTALALKEIGAQQVCVCVGRTEQDFDPKYAAQYAWQLHLDYVFLPLPKIDIELYDLLQRAVRSIEMKDYSNVLMGMCNQWVCDYAKAHSIKYVFCADFADVILGNDMLTYGRFHKKQPGGTPEQWAAWRLRTGLHLLPNNMEVARVFRANEIDFRQVFYHPKIIQFLLSCNFTLTPASNNKVLYKTILDRYIKNASWNAGGKAKIGYYTGSGLGAIRLKNPILQEPSIRSVYSEFLPT